jgi:glycosyltransferase involved in cell wall biosynthesis
VGLVGTFGRWKGHEVFLRALAHVPPALGVRGYVIGGPVYETDGSQHSVEELTRMARELGLAGRVGFTGFTAAPEAIRALDVVVHASTRPEPFGLVIAEAMASGRAVITTATGGAAELVAPGETALTHLPGSERELAACIARLAGDSSFRADLGSRAKTAASRFDADRMAGELVSMYEEVAGRAPRAA